MEKVNEKHEALTAQEVTAQYYDEGTRWLPLDLAATLYAASRTKKWSRTFRTCVVLDEEIDPVVLQQALDDTIKRFPTFKMKLRDGLFWSYFERVKNNPKVQLETKYPYRPIIIEGTDEPCFRILYYKNRIAIEAFHSLTDGGGSSVFLDTLVGRYLQLRGETISFGETVRNVCEKQTVDEAKDSHFDYYDSSVSASNPPTIKAYANENNTIPNYANVIHGMCRVDEIKALAKTKSLTITEYLTALLIYTFCQCADAPITEPIAISVPMDLRKRFESVSVRNFVYMTDITFCPEGRTDVTFDEICDTIRGELKKRATPENLLKSISSNASARVSPIIKPIPYFIKKAFLNNKYKKLQSAYTTFFTNLGEYHYPEEVAKHVLRVESVLADTPYMHFGCAAVSINGLFNFTFCSSNRNKDKQRFFFRYLAQQGIKVRVESNVDYE